MNPELKKAWVEALRSGNYKQGQGFLRTKYDEFCCLGVLADIIQKRDFSLEGQKFLWGAPEVYTSIKDSCYAYTFNGGIGSFDDAILRVLGMSDAEQSELIHMNDHGSSFEEIAEYIEKGEFEYTYDGPCVIDF